MKDTFFRPKSENDPPELGVFVFLLIYIAGADPDFVIQKCREDIGKLQAMGIIALGAFLYNSTIFGAIAIHLAGHADFSLLVGGMALAGYILATDSYIFFRCAHLISGFEQLAQSGLEIAVPRKVQKMVRRMLTIRLAQSASLGLIVGLMTSLVIYSSDIRAQIERDHLKEILGTSRQISDQTDGNIKRATDSVSAATAIVSQLIKQINGKLARGVNPANAVLHALEERRTTEENKLASLKGELSRLQNGRNDKLRADLADDPTVAHQNMGVLAEINALEEIAGNDWKIGFIIFLIEIVAVGFDLAAILAKMNWLPTTYSVLMAREYLERMERVVSQFVPPFPDGPDDPDDRPAGIPINDNDPFDGGGQAANDNIPLTPKRGRGRPRKYPSSAINGSGGTPPDE